MKMLAAWSIVLVSLTAAACAPEERTLASNEASAPDRTTESAGSTTGTDAGTTQGSSSGGRSPVPCTPATCIDVSDATHDGGATTDAGGPDAALAETAAVGETSGPFLDSPIIACYTRNDGAKGAGQPANLGHGARVYPTPGAAGFAQDFAGGYLGPNACLRRADGSAAWMVRGDIDRTYVVFGGPTSSLGFPIGDEYATAEGPRQDFEHGHIAFDASLQAYRAYPSPTP